MICDNQGNSQIHRPNFKILCKRFQIQFFDLLARPGGATQEFETGFDARVIVETADGDAPREFLPAVFLHQPGQDCFEGQAVQGIVGFEVGHDFMLSTQFFSFQKQGAYLWQGETSSDASFLADLNDSAKIS